MAKLFRDYDQAGLDAQLNLRARWPEYPEHLDRWAAESAALRGRMAGRLDLAYGPSTGQTLDLFLPPAAQGPAPLLAFIHGGYWQSLGKEEFSYLAPAFLDQGIAFAAINYDLAPAVSIEEIVAQIRRSLAWLCQSAGNLGLDPDRMVVAGHSAGGHLTAVAALTDWTALDPALPADLLKGACSVSGVYDLEPLRLSYQNPILKLDPDMAARLSPLNLISGKAAPLICAVGSGETDEFLRQQEEFVRKCRAAGLTVDTVGLPGRDHFTAVDALGEAGHPLMTAVCRLFPKSR